MSIETNLLSIRHQIDRLCDRHQWQLLSRNEFATEVAALNPVSDDAIVRYATNYYCKVWHGACCPDHPLRDRAFQELARYVYDRAVYKYSDADLAQELSQETIILVAEQIDRCREPGAFMAFVMMKLWNAATAYFRMRDRHTTRQVDLTVANSHEVDLALANRGQLLPELHAVQAENTERIVARLAEIMQAAPRARNQLLAVLLKFLAALSDEEIASELNTDVANVYVLRSRGLKRLRKDALLRELATEIVGGRGTDP